MAFQCKWSWSVCSTWTIRTPWPGLGTRSQMTPGFYSGWPCVNSTPKWRYQQICIIEITRVFRLRQYTANGVFKCRYRCQYLRRHTQSNQHKGRCSYSSTRYLSLTSNYPQPIDVYFLSLLRTEQLGCCHSSVDSSMPSILPPRVRVPSTPFTLLSIYIWTVSRWKDDNKPKEAHFLKKNRTILQTNHCWGQTHGLLNKSLL